jgi:hemerythrin HHE cation binding domain-containing protein
MATPHDFSPTDAWPATDPGSGRREGIDAVTLLKQEHRRVIEWFQDYDAARSDLDKQELALSICEALRLHAALEEEIFYPAFLRVTRDPITCEVAVHEHTDAEQLIEQILQSSPVDELFDSKVRILADVIAQHVQDEECPGGMFDAAEDSEMDLHALGRQLHERRQELRGNRTQLRA